MVFGRGTCGCTSRSENLLPVHATLHHPLRIPICSGDVDFPSHLSLPQTGCPSQPPRYHYPYRESCRTCVSVLLFCVLVPVQPFSQCSLFRLRLLPCRYRHL